MLFFYIGSITITNGPQRAKDAHARIATMAAIQTFLAIYVFGGLTFIPLLLVFAFFTFTRPAPKSFNPAQGSLQETNDYGDVDIGVTQDSDHAGREPDVAAGYFAVCREYVPGGLNGKPPERKTPAGETIATESPNVYQMIYNRIFDQNKTQGPTLEAGKAIKKARNVFFVVLRYGFSACPDRGQDANDD